jgi:hypothetical protein
MSVMVHKGHYVLNTRGHANLPCSWNTLILIWRTFRESYFTSVLYYIKKKFSKYMVPLTKINIKSAV